MALPLLPGLSFNNRLGKDKFHKSQCFDYRNDVAVHVGETKSGIGGETMPGGKSKSRHSSYPKGDGPQAPAWVAFDRQVLCFDAYFQESVHEKREEQNRIRKCKIYFYLEDDSLQVIEPKVENSGIPQGTLIRRHRIPLPSPNDEEFYTVDHFNIGKQITIYSRNFHITGCDDFTHNFLRKLGVRVNSASSANPPDDPYTSHRHELQESMQPLRPYEKEDTLRQFLQNDRRVLRFQCFWDDTDSMFGDPRQCILHYFLADDTVEIREIIPPNSGRDAVPLFLRRQRLPKEPTDMHQPGKVTKRTVLNVFGPMGQGGRYILDSLKTGAVHADYYHDTDLVVGGVVNVWGRKFLICGCDDFTQEYYKSKYGHENAPPINVQSDSKPSMSREMPPYNGFGSEEDSLCNCTSLIPKPPKRDFIKFMEKDRHGLESNVLRFVAKMDTQRPIEVDRRFTISYFLSDDTVLVFEPPQRNSGIIGGKFLERGRVKKPNGENYYNAQDLYIGSHVEFCRHTFILIDADEYAINYMQQHADEFPHADINKILPKFKQLINDNLSEVKLMLGSADRKKTGTLHFDDFRAIVKKIAGNDLSEHEILTIVRHFGETQSNSDNVDALVATVQDQLRKVNYENFSLMHDACVYQDVHRIGFIPLKELENIFKSFKLPVKDHLLKSLLNQIHTNEHKCLDYREFISFLNWRDNPVHSDKYQPSLSFGVETHNRVGPCESIQQVSYLNIFKSLGFN